MRLLLSLIFITLLVACDPGDSEDWQAVGYQDGYAATINTACGFRTSIIHGKFDNHKYARGYSRGAQAGALAVSQQGCSRLK